jgi:hypothetical protein
MKTIILKVVFITLVTLGLNGCYTIIWSPDSQLPTEDNSVTNIYYGDNYYGDYYYFYDTPWWWDYSYNPPVTGVTRPGRDESTQPIRELGGRAPVERTPPILVTPPPSRDANPPSSGNSGSTGNNGSSAETVRSSSSSSSNSSGRESSSSGSVRNNNGGRSSGGRK